MVSNGIEPYGLPSDSTGTPETGAQVWCFTNRELDVLKLVAQGLANPKIAEELYVGKTTIWTHGGHILSELDLRDQAQMIVFAYETGLIRPGES